MPILLSSANGVKILKVIANLALEPSMPHPTQEEIQITVADIEEYVQSLWTRVVTLKDLEPLLQKKRALRKRAVSKPKKPLGEGAPSPATPEKTTTTTSSLSASSNAPAVEASSSSPAEKEELAPAAEPVLGAASSEEVAQAAATEEEAKPLIAPGTPPRSSTPPSSPDFSPNAQQQQEDQQQQQEEANAAAEFMDFKQQLLEAIEGIADGLEEEQEGEELNPEEEVEVDNRSLELLRTILENSGNPEVVRDRIQRLLGSEFQASIEEQSSSPPLFTFAGNEMSPPPQLNTPPSQRIPSQANGGPPALYPRGRRNYGAADNTDSPSTSGRVIPRFADRARASSSSNSPSSSTSIPTPPPPPPTSKDPKKLAELLPRFPRAWCEAALKKYPNDVQRARKYLEAEKLKLIAKEPDAMMEESGDENYGHRYFLPSNAKVIKPSDRAEQQANEGREVMAQQFFLAVDLSSLLNSVKVGLFFFLEFTSRDVTNWFVIEVQEGVSGPLRATNLAWSRVLLNGQQGE